MKRPAFTLLWCLAVAVSACRSGDPVRAVQPELLVAPTAVDFGAVKRGARVEQSVTLSARSQADVAIESATLSGDEGAFELVTVPDRVDGLRASKLVVAFRPSAAQSYAARLQINSDDPAHGQFEVSLEGDGATPQVAVTTACDAARRCTASATASPPSIQFAPEPKVRLLPIEVTALPVVSIANAGPVPLQLTSLDIRGIDAVSFSLAGAPLPTGGIELQPGTEVSVPIRFVPSTEAKGAFEASVVVGTDDSTRPEVGVPLTGTLRENLPPVLCANVEKVVSEEGTDLYNSAAHYQPPPPGGYDFTSSRPIRPKSDVTLSAVSNDGEPTACTADPDDGRLGLTWLWEILQSPEGTVPPTLGNAASPRATFRPLATGLYTVRLTVTDQGGHAVSTSLHLAASVKEDLAVQLSWTGFSGVDLDLHLVRPSSVTTTDPFGGAFSYFQEPPAGATSGDLNGFSFRHPKNATGTGFDWGGPGNVDDPRLNVDDLGNGQLIENISLRSPENDARCDGGPCTYKVFVHYAGDGRTPSAANTACSVDGGTSCLDGEPCGCPGGMRCVANTAPGAAPARGVGRCFLPPQSIVRVFFKGRPTPAAVVPISPATLPMGAPCLMAHVADVVWPGKGSTTDGGSGPEPFVEPRADFTRFGERASGGLACIPNDRGQGDDWWAPVEPR